jgi:hypothetical protein
MGTPGTGKKVTWSAIDIVRMVDDKAVEHWGVTGYAGLDAANWRHSRARIGYRVTTKALHGNQRIRQ